MRAHRLNRLALLTRGIAVVGLGLADLACGKSAPAPEEPHINSPPEPSPLNAADPAPTVPFHTINAPPDPTPGFHTINAPPSPVATPAVSGSASPHVNSPAK